MGLNDNTPYTNFDSISSGRIYRKNGEYKIVKSINYINPSTSALSTTTNIFGGSKNRYKLVTKLNTNADIISFYVFDYSLENAKHRLLIKLEEKLKNKKIKNKLKYSIEIYEQTKLIKVNNYVFNK